MRLVTLGPVIIARLEKAAADNGFDLPRSEENRWLSWGSTQTDLVLAVTISSESTFLVAASQHNVATTLVQESLAQVASPVALPRGMVAAVVARNYAELHALMRRAFQLSRSLPDELLHLFNKEAAGLPRATEAERLVLQRVGQDVFRRGLIDYWNGRCAVTGLAVPALLRASHIKPWAACAEDAERLDVFNGLLLAPHLDAAFDAGFLTFADDGLVAISQHLGDAACSALNLHDGLRLTSVADGHRRYLPWHRQRVFKRSG